MSNEYLTQIYQKKHTGVNFQNNWQDYCESLKVNRKYRPIRIIVYVGVINVAYYRAFAPFMELAKNPNYEIRISNLLSQQDDIDWADIVYFQRVVDRNIVAEAKRARAACKKVIYDTDDYMHGLPSHHPHKRNIENSRYLIDQDDLAKHCNVITVSTDYLKKMYADRYSCPISVLPNCIRTEDYYCSTVNHFMPDRVYLGWAGSSTHFHDLTIVGPVIRDLIDKYPDLSLVTFNYHGLEEKPYQNAFEGVPLDRRIFIGGTEPALLSNVLRLFDIGIAPILNNDFNRSKSNCKYLEYSMSGVPTVASDLEPYHSDRQFAVLAKENPSDWYQAIETLILDKERRRGLAEKAAAWVRRKYDIKANIKAWDTIFKSII